MTSKVRQKKYRKIKESPKMINFGASKPGIGGGRSPGSLTPLDTLVCYLLFQYLILLDIDYY